MNKTTRFILAVLFVLGIGAALGKALLWGESVTNYGAYVPWGLWVGLYVLLVAAAAGSAWVAVYVSQGDEGAGDLSRMCLITAGASLVFGLAFIGIDLGKPFKGFLIFISPSFSSKLAWASWLYVGFFIAVAGYLFSGAKKAFLYLAAVAAVGFLLAESLFFSGMVARAAWSSFLTPIAFFISAIVAGTAMVCLMAEISGTSLGKASDGLRKILLYAIGADVAMEVIHAFTSGSYFGLIAVAILIAPIYLLLNKEKPLGVMTSGLALFGLAVGKYGFVRYGFSTEAMPGLTEAFQDARLSLAYMPSVVEWLVAIGFVAGMILVADAALKKLMPQSR